MLGTFEEFHQFGEVGTGGRALLRQESEEDFDATRPVVGKCMFLLRLRRVYCSVELP
jgi:hypothetical protein